MGFSWKGTCGHAHARGGGRGKGWKKEGGVTYVLCFPSPLLSVSAEGIILGSSSRPQWALHRAWPTAGAQEISSK